ncbi:LPS export ABC transporter periplasmic protein LptC [Citreicella sp. C3M06]|uniref:LPS export ABC transporter periplasmic protein LptC n=1 Tax=Citreicella sp. C3M06 TaxID=2841564 RepID=UPI001C089B1A|nr:LPS export ABC transporter periplasmic protein LptC [Citreicella sp. C3M06]MBU2959682.1 LPS export ABC transporter periplasmic protein LptC [Citreicella sp. C3M06]
MVRRGDSYTRLIGWLKLLLPLVALVMLSTLFLLPRGSAPVSTLPVVEGDAPSGAREQIVAPVYIGTTQDGDQLRFTADTVEPLGDEAQQMLANRLDAQLDMADGSSLALRAQEARIDSGAMTADLQGAVRIESSTGYVMDTEHMVSAIDRIGAQTLAPVSGTGPAGRFTAGKLVIASDASTGDVQLLFTGGIKLVYDPQDP